MGEKKIERVCGERRKEVRDCGSLTLSQSLSQSLREMGMETMLAPVVVPEASALHPLMPLALLLRADVRIGTAKRAWKRSSDVSLSLTLSLSLSISLSLLSSISLSLLSSLFASRSHPSVRFELIEEAFNLRPFLSRLPPRVAPGVTALIPAGVALG